MIIFRRLPVLTNRNEIQALCEMMAGQHADAVRGKGNIMQISFARNAARRKIYRMGAASATFAILLTGLTVTRSFASPDTPGSHPSATQIRPVEVTYNGHMVSYAMLNRRLGTTYCDDIRGYGKLTCYGTERAMDSYLLAHRGYAPSAAARIARQLDITSYPKTPTLPTWPPGCSSQAIATYWTQANYQGSAVVIYCSYPDLGTIGWNGRVNSAQLDWTGLVDELDEEYNFALRYSELSAALPRLDHVYASIHSERWGN
jgi:hypothetical protein